MRRQQRKHADMSAHVDKAEIAVASDQISNRFHVGALPFPRIIADLTWARPAWTGRRPCSDSADSEFEYDDPLDVGKSLGWFGDGWVRCADWQAGELSSEYMSAFVDGG